MGLKISELPAAILADLDETTTIAEIADLSEALPADQSKKLTFGVLRDWLATAFTVFTIAGAANANALTVTGGTLSVAHDETLASLTQTWNTTGAPTAIKLVVTDTASDGASLFMDLRTSVASKFSVSKAGAVVAASTVSFTGGTFTTTLTSTTAQATLGALAATQGSFYASTVSGATLQGFGTTGDVTLKNRAGTDVLVLTANSSTIAITGLLSVASTISSTTPATTRLTQSEVILSGATIAVGSGGSIAGVRGGITVNAGSVLTEGFLYGTQGKVTLAGEISEGAAARITGLIGQVDLSTGTVTAGQVSAVWGDFQGTPTLTDPSQVNILRATNSSNGTVNAVLFGYGKASYFAQLAADGAAPAYVIATAPSNLVGSLKVSVQGADRYIPLYDTPTP